MAYNPTSILHGNGTQANETDAHIHKVSAGGEETIILPSNDFVADANMTKDGHDLILEAPDGSVLVIEGYFLAEPAPLLEAPGGSVLTPELVNSFAKAPAQFAQIGSLSDESPVGAIEELSGEARVIRTDGSIETVQIGTPIYQGDIVETTGDGAVNIVFVDETSFAISENARLAIDEYVFDPATESGTQNFSVLRGVFVFTSGLIGRDDPDDVEIDTPVGSIGIRGTIIAGDIDPTGESEISVLEGAIVVRNGFGEQTLSVQFETVKLNNFNAEIKNVGVLDAQSIADYYAAVKNVSPGLFSGIKDAAQQQNQLNQDAGQDQPLENNSDTKSEDSNQNEQESSLKQEVKPNQQATDQNKPNAENGTDISSTDQTGKNSTSDGQPPADNAPQQTTKNTVTPDAPPTDFSGRNDSFSGSQNGNGSGNGNALGSNTNGQGSASQTTVQNTGAIGNNVGNIQQNTNNNGDTLLTPILPRENPNGGSDPESPPALSILNLDSDRPNDGVTIIRDTGIGNRIGFSITSGDFFKADGSLGKDGFSDLIFTNDTDNPGGLQHHHYIVNGTDTIGAGPDGKVGTGEIAPTIGYDIYNASIETPAGVYSNDIVSNIGDFDGDGQDDFVTGFQNADSTNDADGNGAGSGEAFISLSDGSYTEFSGAASSDNSKFGENIVGLGDVDRDGKDDFMVSSSSFSEVAASDENDNGTNEEVAIGRVSLYLGKYGTGTPIEFFGDDPNQQFGSSISSAGDFDGDGFLDVAIASTRLGSGKVDIYTGDGTGNFSSTESFPGFDTIAVGGDFELPTFNLGDVNGDGKTDIMIASIGNGVANIHGDGWATNTDTFIVTGGGAAGDFNADGYDDFVLITGPEEGSMADIYVVYGKDGIEGQTLDRGYLDNASNAFHMQMDISKVASGETPDFTISRAGDMNGDGYDDIAIGLSNYDGNKDDGLVDGKVTIVYGRDASNTITPGTVATGDAQSLVGTNSADNTLSDGGHENISMRGGAGNDDFELSSSDGGKTTFRNIDGGAGFDQINISGDLDFTNVKYEQISGIEMLSVRDPGQTLTLSTTNIFNLLETSSDGRLFINDTANASLNDFDSLTLNILSGTNHIDSSTGIANALGGTLEATSNESGYEQISIGSNTLYIEQGIQLVVGGADPI